MSDSSKFDFKQSGNSVAQAYEELLVPRMFVPFGKLFLDEAKLSSGETVLDIACGPGTLSLMAAERVGPNGKVTATDISPPMLDIARSKPKAPGSASIAYVESPAYPLKVDDASFDVTLCQQGLQFFPEKVDALKEMARATKPGGSILVAVWGSLQQCAFWGEMCAGLEETLPSSIADLMKAPFSLSDPMNLKSLAEEAGLKNIKLISHSLPLVFEGGIDQAVSALDATPLAPKIAELPLEKRNNLAENLRNRLIRFLNGSECSSDLVSNILTCQA